MGEYAPAALRWLASQIIANVPSAKLSGIVGDAAHGSGYHRSRNALRSRGLTGDYSIQLAEDRAGDGDAASALDISYDPARMRLVTGRLLKSAKDQDDPRLNVCREFYGTLDGRHVTGWDTHFGRAETSDNSHLWHVHISFLRKYATNDNAMNGVLAVILGEPYEGDTMTTARDFWRYDPGDTALNGIPNGYWRADAKTNKTVTPGFWAGDLWATTHRVEVAALAEAKTNRVALAALTARVDALPNALAPAIVSAVGDALKGGLPADVLAAAVENAVRRVLGSLDNKAT